MCEVKFSEMMDDMISRCECYYATVSQFSFNQPFTPEESDETELNQTELM